MTYRATKGDDGTLIVHDVPIFVECTRGELNFDAAWIDGAVATAKVAMRDGYMPPLHVRHHDKEGADHGVQAAGFFRVTRAGDISFKGEKRRAVFADLIITDRMVADMVMQGRIPYRSVEIFNVEKPELNGLALLDHEAPFLQLPMLMVSRVDGAAGVTGGTFGNTWSCESYGATSTVAAAFRNGRKAMLLFAHDGVTMADTEDKKPDEKKGESMEAGKGLDVKAICKAIEAGEITVADMDAIMAAISGYQTKAAPEAEGDAKAPAPNSAAMSAQRSSGSGDPAKMQTGTTDAVKFAALEGEVAALKAKLVAQDAAAKQREMVAAAVKRLGGRALGSDIEARLATFAAQGEAVLAAFVESIEKLVPPTPSMGDARAASFSAGADMSEAVAAYQAKGPDVAEKAAKFSAQWRESNRIGATRMTEEQFIARAFDRDAMKARSN